MSPVKPLLLMRNVWYMAIKSSNIEECAYDYVNKKLYLTFKIMKGYVYVYNNVDLTWWKEFTKASSKGKYFSKHKMKLIEFTKETLLTVDEYKKIKSKSKKSKKSKSKKKVKNDS